MRLAVKQHAVTDVGPAAADLAGHMHEVHHLAWADIRPVPDDELEVMHADDHADLRRGVAQ